jgi:hypothetical protein
MKDPLLKLTVFQRQCRPVCQKPEGFTLVFFHDIT